MDVYSELMSERKLTRKEEEDFIKHGGSDDPKHAGYGSTPSTRRELLRQGKEAFAKQRALQDREEKKRRKQRKKSVSQRQDIEDANEAKEEKQEFLPGMEPKKKTPKQQAVVDAAREDAIRRALDKRKKRKGPPKSEWNPGYTQDPENSSTEYEGASIEEQPSRPGLGIQGRQSGRQRPRPTPTFQRAFGTRNIGYAEKIAQDRYAAQRTPMTGQQKTDMRRRWGGDTGATRMDIQTRKQVPTAGATAQGARARSSFARPGMAYALRTGTEYEGPSLSERGYKKGKRLIKALDRDFKPGDPKGDTKGVHDQDRMKRADSRRRKALKKGDPKHSAMKGGKKKKSTKRWPYPGGFGDSTEYEGPSIEEGIQRLLRQTLGKAKRGEDWKGPRRKAVEKYKSGKKRAGGGEDPGAVPRKRIKTGSDVALAQHRKKLAKVGPSWSPKKDDKSLLNLIKAFAINAESTVEEGGGGTGTPSNKPWENEPPKKEKKKKASKKKKPTRKWWEDPDFEDKRQRQRDFERDRYWDQQR